MLSTWTVWRSDVGESDLRLWLEGSRESNVRRVNLIYKQSSRWENKQRQEVELLKQATGETEKSKNTSWRIGCDCWASSLLDSRLFQQNFGAWLQKLDPVQPQQHQRVQHWCSGDKVLLAVCVPVHSKHVGLRSRLSAGQWSSFTPSWENQDFLWLSKKKRRKKIQNHTSDYTIWLPFK